MNSTIALSQIILRLTKISGVDTATARHFVRAFFGTIEEALIHGESVTIKGIGTFRPVEGLDASAGPKVAFMPDADLAARINAPFEMFEAVELADGLDFPEEEEEPEVNPAPEAQPEEEAPQVTEPEPEPEVAPEPEATPEPEPAYDITPAPEQVQEPAVVPVEVTEPVAEPDPEPVEEPEPEQEEEPEPVVEEKKSALNPLVIGIGLIIVGGFTGFLAANYDPDDSTDAQSDWQEEVSIATPDTTSIVEDVAVEDIAQPVQEDEPVVTPTHTLVEEAPAPAAEPIYDTVSSTNYLATMARKYYGKSGYWVFIYQANSDKLSNPNRISPGTKVLIPDKSSFAEATEEATARKAEQLRRELNEKYGN
ncbi:MAG: hypothetical protein HDS65_00480 [Bacteroidales bacterium]|nr:hypothetical protein [Bacteroidales bacterium]